MFNVNSSHFAPPNRKFWWRYCRVKLQFIYRYSSRYSLAEKVCNWSKRWAPSAGVCEGRLASNFSLLALASPKSLCTSSCSLLTIAQWYLRTVWDAWSSRLLVYKKFMKHATHKKSNVHCSRLLTLCSRLRTVCSRFSESSDVPRKALAFRERL